MTKNTYLVTSFLLIGIVLLGSRYLGFNFIERLVSVFIVAGLFELIYKFKYKTSSNDKSKFKSDKVSLTLFRKIDFQKQYPENV